MFKALKSKKGFTLVELMVVVAILAILVAVAIPVYNSVTTNAEKNACLANARTIDSAILQYNADSGNATKIVLGTTAMATVQTNLTGNYLAVWPVCPVTGNTYGWGATNTTLVSCSDTNHAR